MQLENKVAIVTGGASGLGKAICLKFASEGAKIAIADINADGANAVAEKIKAMGREAIPFTVDVGDYERVAEVVQSTLERFGTIDILVNCAGDNVLVPPEETTVELWKKLLAVNLDGQWYFCKEVMKEMMRKRSGKIINISSGAGIRGITNSIPYTAAKHGVIGLTRALAVDLGRYNINVNCICPGTFPTPLMLRATGKEYTEKTVKYHPLGRLGKPEELADAALFLASHASDWITGAVLPVDGGLFCGLLYALDSA